MSRHKVLVVDDEPDLLAALVRVIKAAGFDVRSASNGEAAILEVDRSTPDLILCDVMMPGLNGFQTTRRLKQGKTSASIPVLLMSAKADPADRFWAEEVGAIALLKKPFDTRDLVQRIGDAIDGRAEQGKPVTGDSDKEEG